MTGAKKWLALLLVLWLPSVYGQGIPGYPGYQIQCADALDSLALLERNTLDENLGILVIVTAGGSDCGEVDGRNYLMPTWAIQLVNPADPYSLARYAEDNGLGNLTVTGTVANRGDDSCFYSRHIPCGRWWGCGMWCDSCSNNCGCSCPCACEYDSFYTDILSQVDAEYDLSVFDQTGPAGQPDGVVDYVLLIHYNYREDGRDATFMGVGRLLENFPTNDGVSISRGITCWTGDDYLSALALIAHEWGHSQGQPDWGHRGTADDFDHLALGGFDVDSHGGFNDGVSEGFPSLFNPWNRAVFRPWAQVDSITGTKFDYALKPYSDPRISYSDQGRCYKLASPLDPNQHFFVTAHNRSSTWEQFWPDEGLLIWRFNGNSWSNRLDTRERRLLEIEPASGLWDWEQVGVYESPSPDDTNTYVVALRTDQANPASGFDSLDFQFTQRNGQTSFMYDEATGYRGVGGAGASLSPRQSNGRPYQSDRPPAREPVAHLSPFPQFRNRHAEHP